MFAFVDAEDEVAAELRETKIAIEKEIRVSIQKNKKLLPVKTHPAVLTAAKPPTCGRVRMVMKRSRALRKKLNQIVKLEEKRKQNKNDISKAQTIKINRKQEWDAELSVLEAALARAPMFVERVLKQDAKEKKAEQEDQRLETKNKNTTTTTITTPPRKSKSQNSNEDRHIPPPSPNTTRRLTNLHCEICDTSTRTREAMKAHMIGKKHLKNIKKILLKQRIEQGVTEVKGSVCNQQSMMVTPTKSKSRRSSSTAASLLSLSITSSSKPSSKTIVSPWKTLKTPQRDPSPDASTPDSIPLNNGSNNGWKSSNKKKSKKNKKASSGLGKALARNEALGGGNTGVGGGHGNIYRGHSTLKQNSAPASLGRDVSPYDSSGSSAGSTNSIPIQIPSRGRTSSNGSVRRNSYNNNSNNVPLSPSSYERNGEGSNRTSGTKVSLFDLMGSGKKTKTASTSPSSPTSTASTTTWARLSSSHSQSESHTGRSPSNYNSPPAKTRRYSLEETMILEETKRTQRQAVHVDGHRTKWYRPEDGPRSSFLDIQNFEKQQEELAASEALVQELLNRTSSKSIPTWQCDTCTFINESNTDTCTMCRSSKHQKKVHKSKASRDSGNKKNRNKSNQNKNQKTNVKKQKKYNKKSGQNPQNGNGPKGKRKGKEKL